MRPAQQRGEREEKHQNSVTFGSEKDTRSFYNIESWWTTYLLHITAVAMFFHGITHKSSDSLFSLRYGITAEISINSFHSNL